MRTLLAILLLVAVLPVRGDLLAQPAPSAPEAAGGDGEVVLVLAASSLTDVLPRVARSWTAQGGATVRFSFDATSRLAPQIEAGAPADVFVSADEEWIDWLDGRDLVVEGSVRIVARNELVFVVPRGGAAAPEEPGDVASLGPVGVAGENVPAGRYARDALRSAGVWESLEGRVVTGASVRGVLEWVARGEVDGGVVYRTDALAEPDVEVAFAFSGDLHPPVRYAAAVPVTAPSPRLARDFVDFLAGPGGAVLLDAGFSPPDVPSRTVDAGAATPGALAETGSGRTTDAQARASFDTRAGEPAASVTLPSVGSAIRLSLLVALVSTLLGLVPAVGLGWLLARHDFTGKTLVTTVVLAPLVLPPVVTGFLLLSLLGRQSALGSVLSAAGLTVPFTLLGAMVAAFVVGLPLYVLSVRGAFEAVDPQYEELSWTLGVPPRRTFLRVSLPLALPGIVAGAILAFARALGEFGATVVLAGNMEGSTRTIALAVYTLLEAPSGRETTWLLVGASVGLSLLALGGYEAFSRWQRRRVRDEYGR